MPTGVLVITATTDPQTGQRRIRVRSSADVLSIRDQVVDTGDPDEVLDLVRRWLSEVRDAPVTVRPHPPVTVIRPDLEPEREDE